MKTLYSYILLLNLFNSALVANPNDNRQHQQVMLQNFKKIGTLSKIGMGLGGIGTIIMLYKHETAKNADEKHKLCHFFQIGFGITFLCGMLGIADYTINKFENLIKNQQEKQIKGDR